MSKAERVIRLKMAGRVDRGSVKGVGRGGGDSRSQDVADPAETSVSGLRSGLADFEWWGEYVGLCERFEWRKAAYIAWCASPARTRKPRTVAELATALGYKSDRTFRQWKADNGDIELAIREIQASPLVRHRRDIYVALVDSALLLGSQGFQDRRLSLQMLGDLDVRDVEGAAVDEFTADELAEAERELVVWEKEESGSSG